MARPEKGGGINVSYAKNIDRNAPRRAFEVGAARIGAGVARVVRPSVGIGGGGGGMGASVTPPLQAGRVVRLPHPPPSPP